MASLGTLALNVVAKTAPFTKALKGARSQVASFGASINSLQGRLAAFTGVAGLGGLATWAVKASADMESTRTAFRVMLKDAQKADKVIADLFEFSKKTPFEPKEVFQAGRGLLAAGFAAEDLRKELKMIGDIAAGSQSNLLELIAAYQQVGTTGRLELSDVNKFANRGIPIYEALAEVMGVTKGEIRTLSQNGKIGLRELQDAMREMTSEAGAYNNAMEEQSKGLIGLWSTLKGNMQVAATNFGDAITNAGRFREILRDVNTMLSDTDWAAWAQIVSDAFGVVNGVLKDMRLGLLRNEIIKKQYWEVSALEKAIERREGLKRRGLAFDADALARDKRRLKEQTTELSKMVALEEDLTRKQRMRDRGGSATELAIKEQNRLKQQADTLEAQLKAQLEEKPPKRSPAGEIFFKNFGEPKGGRAPGIQIGKAPVSGSLINALTEALNSSTEVLRHAPAAAMKSAPAAVQQVSDPSMVQAIQTMGASLERHMQRLIEVTKQAKPQLVR